jgi:acyl-CoA synthetase (AMP-forming)/AMP-acid ligase II
MNLSFYLEINAKNNPFGTALIHKDKSINFRQLNILSNKFANLLRKQNINKGERIILLLPNTAEFVFAFFGSLKAGVIPLPINFRLRQSDILFMMNDIQAKAIITLESLSQEVCDIRKNNQKIDIITFGPDFELKINGYHSEFHSLHNSYYSVPKQSNEIASLMYTAGSSGKPKPVIHTHGNHLYRCLGFISYFNLNNRDVGLAVSPLFHISGLYVMIRSMVLGVPCVLIEKWDVEEFLKSISYYKATFFHLITTAFLDVINTEPQLLNKYDIKSARLAYIGGGICTIEQIEYFEEIISGWCSEGYGRTEGGAAWNPNNPHRKLGSNGLVLLNSNEIMIAIDGDPDKPAKNGDLGEILVRGDEISPGYFNRPQINKEIFRKGWMLTNDLGILDDDGFLYFKGRKDDLIKTGGENVYPAEIEACLLKFKGIKEVAVLGLPDYRWGEKIVAVVKSDRSINENDIKAFCKKTLPNFKCPKEISFVKEMPRIGPKKIDKALIKKKILKK